LSQLFSIHSPLSQGDYIIYKDKDKDKDGYKIVCEVFRNKENLGKWKEVIQDALKAIQDAYIKKWKEAAQNTLKPHYDTYIEKYKNAIQDTHIEKWKVATQDILKAALYSISESGVGAHYSIRDSGVGERNSDAPAFWIAIKKGVPDITYLYIRVYNREMNEVDKERYEALRKGIKE